MEIFYKITFDETGHIVQIDSSNTEGDGFKAYTKEQIKLFTRLRTTKEMIDKALEQPK